MRLLALFSIFLFTSTLFAQDVGLQLYSLRNHMSKDLQGSLDSIQAWGIHHVEDGNDGTYGLPFDEYKQLLTDHQIEMVSVSASYEELQKNPKAVAARAKAYGAKYAVCFWIPHADTVLTKRETRKASKVFNKAGKVLAKVPPKGEDPRATHETGITLLYHPHGYEFVPHPKGGMMLDELVRKSKHYDFELDIYWIERPGQDAVEWMQRYPGEFRLLHLKDCQKGVPHALPHNSDVETNVVLGTGQFNIEGVIKEGIKQGIPYMFVEDESSKVMKQAGKSAEFVREVLRAN